MLRNCLTIALVPISHNKVYSDHESTTKTNLFPY
jgi:hypothetical protein